MRRRRRCCMDHFEVVQALNCAVTAVHVLNETDKYLHREKATEFIAKMLSYN
jgi:hypothetical protein